MFSLNRIVAVLTPLVFAPAAAAVAGWSASHFPGLPQIDPGQLVAVEIAGATAALGTGLSWLHGHQKWNQILADLIRDGHVVDAVEAGFVKVKSAARTAEIQAPTLSLAPADQPPPLAAAAQTPAGEPALADQVPAPRDPVVAPS